MRFKQFITETSELGLVPIVKPVNQEEMLEFLKKNPIAKANLLDNITLFRGFPSEGAFSLGDTSLFKRKAANTSNFVNVYLSTVPTWKHFPSREHAYIGSTYYYGADGFGQVHVMIPADDAKIGICPTNDFWNSFATKTRKNVQSVNAVLRQVARILGVTLDDTNGTILRGQLEQLTTDMLGKKIPEERAAGLISDDRREFLLYELDYMEKRGIANLAEYLDYILEPIEFHIVSQKDIRGHLERDREVWVQGKCAFIQNGEAFQIFVDELRDQQ